MAFLPRAHKDPSLPVPDSCTDEAAWLASLHAVPPEFAPTLVAITRTLYPHDRLPDAVYRRVLLQLDRACAVQPKARGWLIETAAAMDAACGQPFATLSETYRVAALRALDGTPAFRFLQRGTVRFLYDDLEVWQAFGYEGASHHLGGYVERGFDDLAWLPPVPVDGEGAR